MIYLWMEGCCKLFYNIHWYFQLILKSSNICQCFLTKTYRLLHKPIFCNFDKRYTILINNSTSRKTIADFVTFNYYLWNYQNTLSDKKLLLINYVILPLFNYIISNQKLNNNWRKNVLQEYIDLEWRDQFVRDSWYHCVRMDILTG